MLDRHGLRRQVSNEIKLRRYTANSFFGIVLLCIAVSFIFGELGIIRYRELSEREHALKREVLAITAQNQEARENIERIKTDDFALEKHLREEYGLTGKDEVTFVSEDEQTP